jgi:hypothetical protein
VHWARIKKLTHSKKKPPRLVGTAQFGVILEQPAAGQAKEKFFLSTNFSSAAGETE